MANSGTIDPAGTHGGPVTATNATPDIAVELHLDDDAGGARGRGSRGRSTARATPAWRQQYASLANYATWDPTLVQPDTNPEVMVPPTTSCPTSRAFRDPTSPLYEKAFKQTFPNDFVADVQVGALPSVSWIIPPLGFDEHPSASPMNGQYFISLVLDALTSNPKVWAKTALFLMYDENDGWFDHVPPPTAPKGTAGEYLTATPSSRRADPDTLGITGPLGLGVRVPLLVISPFSRGGHIASEVFDHTSQLQLISERFGVESQRVRLAPDGRRPTSTLFTPADRSVPALPAPPTPTFALSGSCSTLSQDDEQGRRGPGCSGRPGHAHPAGQLTVPASSTRPPSGGAAAGPRPRC